MERPEKKRAGSAYERLRDARAASLALVEPCWTRAPRRREAELPRGAGAVPCLADRPAAGKMARDAGEGGGDHLPCAERRPSGLLADPRQGGPAAEAVADAAGRGLGSGRSGNGTALHIFARTPRKSADEQAQIVRMLLQAGAGLDDLDYGGLTPLVRAVEYGGLNEAAALLRARAEARGPEGPPPRLGRLLRSAEGKPRMFRLLLENGAHPPPGSATRRAWTAGWPRRSRNWKALSRAPSRTTSGARRNGACAAAGPARRCWPQGTLPPTDRLCHCRTRAAALDRRA